MKTIQITKREQHVLMTVVRAAHNMFLDAHGIVDRYVRRQPGMTEPDAQVPTPVELESLLERLGEEQEGTP